MSNPSKRKGTAYEVALADFFNERGLAAYRKAPSGAQDKGDIGFCRFTVEAKACKEITLAAFLDEAVTEAKNAGTEFHLLAIKRRMKGVGESYAVMTMEQFVGLASAFIDLAREVELRRAS